MMICLCSKLVLSAVNTFMFTALKKKNCTFYLSMGLTPLFFPVQKEKSKLF